MPTDTEPETKIASKKVEYLESEEILHSMTAKIAKGPLQLLAVHGKSLGYTLATGPKDIYGMRQTTRAAKAMKPPAGEAGLPVQEVSVELHVQNFTKLKSKDQGALVSVTIRAGDNVETHEMLLEAPNGDFSQAKEYFVKDNKVTPARSWWTAIQKCVKAKCVQVCVSALVSCKGGWAAYMGCVALKCGSCWGNCVICATCNCKWWCKWSHGCCKQ